MPLLKKASVLVTTGVTLVAITAIVSYTLTRNRRSTSSARRSANQDLTRRGTTSMAVDKERMEEVEVRRPDIPQHGGAPVDDDTPVKKT